MGGGRREPDRASPLLFVASVAVWLAAAGPPGERTVAEWFGMLVFHLAAAAAMRWLYTRPQKPRPPVMSPALFLIAAGVALLGRFGPA